MRRCPDEDTLEFFAQASLKGPQAAAIELHLARCRRCATRLAELPVHQELLERVREWARGRSAEAPGEMDAWRTLEERISTSLFPEPM